MKKKDLCSNVCEYELIEICKNVAFIPIDKPEDNQDCWFLKQSNRTKFKKRVNENKYILVDERDL